MRIDVDDITHNLQVTGANRGIGFCIAEQLCKQFDGTVILTGKIKFYVFLNILKPKQWGILLSI